MKYMFVKWPLDKNSKAFNDKVSMSIDHFKTINSPYSYHRIALDCTKEKPDTVFVGVTI